MGKRSMKPSTMLNPVPVVMVSSGTMEQANIITIAWAGTVCSEPPMVSISVRPERHSYGIIKQTGEFVINLVTEDLVKSCDYCGVKSGREIDKFAKLNLTKLESETVAAPSIAQSPVRLECKVKQTIPLGSHDVFLAEVTGVTVDDKYFDEKDKFDLAKAGLVTYSHGEYFSLNEMLGFYGYSVAAPDVLKRRMKKG